MPEQSEKNNIGEKGISRISRTNWHFRFPQVLLFIAIFSREEICLDINANCVYVSIFHCLRHFLFICFVCDFFFVCLFVCSLCQRTNERTNQPAKVRSERSRNNSKYTSSYQARYALRKMENPEWIESQISMQIMPKVKPQEFCWYVNMRAARSGDGKLEIPFLTSAHKFFL